MLKYDFLIRRDEGDEIRDYKPDLIPRELADVIYIEGPNSTGKSTFLNMLALSFFGLKLSKDELNPALRERITNLINSEHQKIQFNFEIKNEKLSTYLRSTKPNLISKEFYVRKKIGDKEKPITAEQFHKEFKLIYDIPNNPLERLPLLLTEIRSAQILRARQVQMLGNFIRETIEKIREARDPAQLNDLDSALKKQEKEHKKLETGLNEIKEFLLNFQKFYFSKIYLDYKELLEKTKKRRKEIEKSKKEIKKEEKEQSKTEDSLLKDIAKSAKEAREYYYEATNYLKKLIPKSEKHHLDIWLDSECSKEINQPEIYQSLRHEADFFINLFPKLMTKDDEAKIQEANFYKSLVNVLKEYSHTDITIPETNKTITEFIEILRTRIYKHEQIINKNKNIKECKESIENMKKIIEQGIENTEKYKSIVKDHKKTMKNISDISSTYEYKQLQMQEKFYEEKKSYFAKELIKINVEESDVITVLSTLRYGKEFETYEVYTETQLSDRLNRLNEDINKDKEYLDRIKRIIKDTKFETEEIRKRKPHKYQEYLPALEKFFKLVQGIEKKLTVTFDIYIERMINKDADTKTISDEEKEYRLQVAKFLAEKVRYIKHIDKNYLVKKIDVMEEKILTDKDKIIRFKDIGTGQSQAAYLMGLLSMTDHRKIIALFDEVAMMDSNTMKPIFDKLIDLYRNKQLLLAVIIQRAEEFKVKKLV